MNAKRNKCALLLKFGLAAFMTVLMVSTSEERRSAEESPKHKRYNGSDLIAEIFPARNNTFGYNILSNGQILIHQPHMPARIGNDGFKIKEDAQKAAEFVITKMRKGVFPPSVSVQELDSLGVL